jgi:hypothetical protein
VLVLEQVLELQQRLALRLQVLAPALLLEQVQVLEQLLVRRLQQVLEQQRLVQ